MRISPIHLYISAALVALAALAFGPRPAQAAVIEAWVHRYSSVASNSVDQVFKVVSDAAGDIIVTGTTDNGITGQDMLTLKYSGADGSVLWQTRYNGPATSDDTASGLAVDGSGNVVVTGTSQGDYYTARYAAADGALLWEKRRPGKGLTEVLPDYQGPLVAVDGSGNVLVTGLSGGDFHTAKYAAQDGVLLWEKRYDGPAKFSDFPRAVAVDGNGDVVVTGSSRSGPRAGWYPFEGDDDYYTAKYAAVDGALLWERGYNGPGNYYDSATAVAVDATGNVVVTGTSQNAGLIDESGYDHSNVDYYTAKYAAADGAVLWEKRYNGPADREDKAQAVAVDNSGNVIVTGASMASEGWNYYTAKYAAADGALLWERQRQGPRNREDQPQAVAVDGSGNVIVTGSSQSDAANFDYYTAKYASQDGALLWEKRDTGPANEDDVAQALAMDASGDVVVTGTSRTSQGDYYTAKYAAADGALLWEKNYDGPANKNDGTYGLAVDGNGNVAVTGSSYGGDVYTAKYAASGVLLWEKRSRGGEGLAASLDGGGNVVVTGYSYGHLGFEYYTAKYAAADGTLLWEKRYARANSDNQGLAVAVDASGNVVVTGTSDGDFYTAKYSATGGALLWEKRYNGPANEAAGVAIDANGNVVVTGTATKLTASGSVGDYYTAKYAAADGHLLWERRYNGPGQDMAFSVVLDLSENVIVTGFSQNGTTGWDFDYYTAKYAAADGHLLWEHRYSGLGTDRDIARAVAVDESGNAIVTGSATGSGGWDYYTAKYAAADGALLWERRYNGPGNGDDQPQAVAVDGSGNVIVTGSSLNSTGTSDYYTAKYASPDGTLLWEKPYNGPANGDDQVRGLALGPNGMVAITGVSDGNFSEHTAFDSATVVYWEMLPPVAIVVVPTGIRLRFTGTAGQSYSIQRAPAVAGPWSTINTQTASAAILLEYPTHLRTQSPASTASWSRKPSAHVPSSRR